MKTAFTFYYESYENGVKHPHYYNITAYDEREAYHKFVDYAYDTGIDIDKVSRGVYLSMSAARASVEEYWGKLDTSYEDDILPQRYRSVQVKQQKSGLIQLPTIRTGTR